jgi:hypothetical protein
MQICQVSRIEAERILSSGLVDCHSHKHLSRRDADQAVADGIAVYVSDRMISVVGLGPLSGHWYDKAVAENDRYLGTALSGAVRTSQLVNFMPRGIGR